jgi:putative addiction module component (TIGR02574 family)
MSTQAFDSAKELALSLSEAERAKLAADLVASLDGPPDADAAEQWEQEILRRLKQIDDGRATFVTPEDLRATIRKRLARV